jgi:hypothetical protein
MKKPADADIDRLVGFVPSKTSGAGLLDCRPAGARSKRTDGCVCHARYAAAAPIGIAEGHHAACRIGAFFDPMIVIAADDTDAPGTARADDKPDVMRPNGDHAGGRTGGRTAISGE